MSCRRTRDIARGQYTVRLRVRRQFLHYDKTTLIRAINDLSQVASFAVLYVVGTRFKQVQSQMSMLMLALQASVCL